MAIAVFDRVFNYIRNKLADGYDDALKTLAEERGYGYDIEDMPEVGRLVIDFQDAGPREDQGMQFYAADISIEDLDEDIPLRYPVVCLFATGASRNLGDGMAASAFDGQVDHTLRITLEWPLIDGRTPTWDKYRRDAQLVADAVMSAINSSTSETTCVLGGRVDNVTIGPLRTVDNGRRQEITFRIGARVAL